MGNMFRPKTKDIQINRETEEEMKSRLCQSMGVNLGKTKINKVLVVGPLRGGGVTLVVRQLKKHFF